MYGKCRNIFTGRIQIYFFNFRFSVKSKISMLSMEELKKKRQILSNFQAKSKNARKDFPRDANPRGANLLFGIIFAESA